MPKHLVVRTLCEICLDSVVDDFETICFGYNRNYHGFKELIEKGSFQESESSLCCLPSSLINQLADKLIDTRGLKPHVIKTVFISGLTECRLLPQISALPLALQTIEKNCGRLQVFQLTCCKSIEVNLINSVLRVSPNLHSLNLEGTSITDECLDILGESCAQLSALNLARTKITNAGVERMTHHNFPKLVFLIILGTLVNAECVMNLISRLPFLLTLEFDNLLQVLRGGPPSRNYQLRKVGLVGLEDNDSLVVGSSLVNFTNLEAVSLEYSSVLPPLLTYLSKLEHLSKLELGSRETAPFNNITSYLQAKGGGLTHLSLENYTNCDIHDIGTWCKNLVVLKFSQCKFSSNIFRSTFQNLEQFFLFNSPDSSFPEIFLKSILSADNISVLYLQNVDHLTDDVFVDALEENCMKHLASVSLENCHRIGLSGIIKLLNSENLLENLHIWSCVQISQFQQQLIRQLIKLNFLQVNFQWQGVPTQIDYQDPAHLEDLLIPLLGVNILPE